MGKSRKGSNAFPIQSRTVQRAREEEEGGVG